MRSNALCLSVVVLFGMLCLRVPAAVRADEGGGWGEKFDKGSDKDKDKDKDKDNDKDNDKEKDHHDNDDRDDSGKVHGVPEVNPAGMTSLAILLAGGAVVVTSRRRKADVPA